MTFRDPWWLLAGLFAIALWWLSRLLRRPALRFASAAGLRPVAAQSRPFWLRLPALAKLASLLLIVIGLARPRQGLETTKLTAKGIDIVLAVDVSTSMLAEDFEWQGQRRNRLEVVKHVVREFVEHRPNDRIGLVIFAGRPYTQSPLTLDHGWLLSQLERTKIGILEDGTAIGSGIATGLNRLRTSKSKSRVMVLLTDGVNNAGTVTPDTAAELARSMAVKIYAIGAGTKGLAPFPAKDAFGRVVYQPAKIEVDDEGLTRIAEATGGLYFRATDTESLKRVYQQIDQLEKTTIEQPRYLVYREWYPWLVASALALLLLEIALSQTWLRVLP
jgi:Ca-activated chloride channel family protein